MDEKRNELLEEREYAAHVQQLLYAVINQSEDFNGQHSQTIRALLADAWEELRLKPTALSPKDLEQLSIDLNRYMARKAFNEDMVRRYERMLLTPFFARVDFAEENAPEAEQIVIGLYSLRDENGRIAVHDWRAPVCSLYYDAQPGPASYLCPEGEIQGTLTLKRQYKMQDGRLEYFVDTDVSIDDEMLLDILSRATSRHMRQIVSTIQREQNAVIRLEKEPVLCVVGAAGSGKTSVALHRASYLLYHHRDQLDAAHIEVISPSTAFIDYISNVLPDLGEQNVRSRTMHHIIRSILDMPTETPLEQNEVALTGSSSFRKRSIQYKSTPDFRLNLEAFVENFSEFGPRFETLRLGKKILMEQKELERLYREEFRLLNPSLRLIRMQAVLDVRLRDWESALKTQYEDRLSASHKGRDLDIAVRMAVSQRLMPVRTKIRQMLSADPLALYAQAVGEDEDMYLAAQQNALRRLIWWEDAPAIAYLMLRLGFAKPDSSIKQLIIDEAQDYTELNLRALRLYYPRAQVTILGDPNQRTSPLQPKCEPTAWGACFGRPDAPVQLLTRSYRSTLPIARLLHAILPQSSASEPIGREGAAPLCAVYSAEKLREKLAQWAEEKIGSVAVVTRTLEQAKELGALLPEAMLLTDEEDMLPESNQPVLTGYHLLKGLEFDAVAVVWPEEELGEDERCRLYTACSRALHDCCLLAGEGTLRQLALNT
ncbi:MAG: AAA family ATPase [Eubacteriales bacterium]|nr:AAA family ATPase [Eubacteriales bacterium]